MQDTYTLLREFADSWMLLAMTFFFIVVVVFTFRPGSRKLHDDIAGIPLRNDDVPLSARKEDQ
ncbi:MAG: cytochrome c oxidase cbb3-type subunit 4 [Paracoccaceae bacterium]|jgi:cytochrome c oxidase cbb3-type subunit 4